MRPLFSFNCTIQEQRRVRELVDERRAGQHARHAVQQLNGEEIKDSRSTSGANLNWVCKLQQGRRMAMQGSKRPTKRRRMRTTCGIPDKEAIA